MIYGFRLCKSYLELGQLSGVLVMVSEKPNKEFSRRPSRLGSNSMLNKKTKALVLLGFCSLGVLNHLRIR